MTDTQSSRVTVGKVLGFILATVIFFILVSAVLYSHLFGPTGPGSSTAEFMVKPDEPIEQVAQDLATQGYVRGTWIFHLAYLRASDGHPIRPGGYEISKNMDAWSIASALMQRPYVAWVTIPVGLRKEQIALRLEDALGWSPAQTKDWLAITDTSGKDYVEGVYFPDTYLIPTDQTPLQVAARFRARFQEVFAPYADEAVKKKVPWPTVLTIASIIQREAGSVADMSIISGIIQKRMAVGMPLAMDATLQYMTGSEDTGWWPAPERANSYPDSPFNTYKRKGLPPHAIANPGLAAIEAALNPKVTNCLFYVHDAKGVMHCSPTYAGQVANINRYLK